MPLTPPVFANTSVCPRCGAGLACAMVAGAGPQQTQCWCTQLPPVMPVPALPDGADRPALSSAACYCRACLQDIVQEQQRAHALSNTGH